MGQDKGLLREGGQTLVERGVAALRSHASEVVLACGASPRYAELGLPLALEAEPGQGPLAGFVAGLRACGGERVLVAAVDLPRLGDCPLAELVAEAITQDVDLAGFDDGRERPPLVWVVRRSCLPALERAFDAGARRLLDGFVGLSMATVPVASALTVNWNTPEDLEAGREGAA